MGKDRRHQPERAPMEGGLPIPGPEVLIGPGNLHPECFSRMHRPVGVAEHLPGQGNGACLHHHQAGAPDCATPEMDQVPVAGKAVTTGILAHGGDEYPVAEGDITKCEMCEKFAHDTLRVPYDLTVGV